MRVWFETAGGVTLLVSGVVGAAVALWKSPVRLALVTAGGWVWRKLWRDAHGEHNGPTRRLLRQIDHALTPRFDALHAQIDEVRSAARLQHDEQNVKIDRIDGRVERIEEHLTAPGRPGAVRRQSAS